MVQFALAEQQHDPALCGALGAAAGGAVRAHDYRSRPGFVLLTFDDGAIDEATFDATVAAFTPPPAPESPRAKLRRALAAATTVTALRQALIDWIDEG